MATPIPIDLVVFDLTSATAQGSVEVRRCLLASLESVEFNVDPDAIDEVVGLPDREMIRLLIGRFDPSGQFLGKVDAIRSDFIARLTCAFKHDQMAVEAPGLSEVFFRLQRAEIAVAIVSSFRRDLTDLLLRRLGWTRRRLIDATVTDDEVERSRPHPDMILAMMNRVGIVDPARVAKVGHTPADLLEAHRAGCGLIVGFAPSSSAKERLQGHPHSYLIDSMDELPELLNLA
ncbi:hypothetical protein BH23PLA1_BH23PLA1_13900 [soil metagenome]